MRKVDARGDCRNKGTGVLKGFEHIAKMEDERFYKIMYKTKLDSVRGRGRRKKRRTEGVKEFVQQRGLSHQESERRATNRNE